MNADERMAWPRDFGYSISLGEGVMFICAICGFQMGFVPACGTTISDCVSIASVWKPA